VTPGVGCQVNPIGSDSTGRHTIVSSQAASSAAYLGTQPGKVGEGDPCPGGGVERDAAGGDPVGVGGQAEVNADPTLGAALSAQTEPVPERPERAAADHGRDLGMRVVDVRDAQLDHDADMRRQDVGDQRSHPRMGTVRTDQQVADLRATVRELEPMSPIGQRYAAAEPSAPANRALRQRVEQEPAQCDAVDFGTSAWCVVGSDLVDQHPSGAIRDPQILTLWASERVKLSVQSGLMQGQLSRLRVKVEGAALSACVRRRLAFEDEWDLLAMARPLGSRAAPRTPRPLHRPCTIEGRRFPGQRRRAWP
jgi:hypothetical protein